MSRINSLKFLILQRLSKNKAQISEHIHKEIAYSLKIILKNNYFILQWEVDQKKFEINIDEKKFNFYIKSEFEQSSRREQIDENEINAEKLAFEIIHKSIN